MADAALEYFKELQTTTPGSPDQVMVSECFVVGEARLLCVSECILLLFSQMNVSKNESTTLTQVFDIDETTLSNAAEWLDTRTASSSSGGSSHRTLRGDEVKERAQSADDRPALEAVRVLYQYLYELKYSVSSVSLMFRCYAGFNLRSIHIPNHSPLLIAFARSDCFHHRAL